MELILIILFLSIVPIAIYFTSTDTSSKDEPSDNIDDVMKEMLKNEMRKKAKDDGLDKLWKMHTMYYSVGCEVDDDDKLVYTGTKEKADGKLFGYYPKFMGFGKSDKVRTKVVAENGEVISITTYDRSGNIIKETHRDN